MTDRLALHEAVQSGTCDYCRQSFEEGEFVAQPDGDEVMCPACIAGLMILEAS